MRANGRPTAHVLLGAPNMWCEAGLPLAVRLAYRRLLGEPNSCERNDRSRHGRAPWVYGPPLPSSPI